MNNNLKEQNMQGNRNYKDSLFRMIFERKEDLLDLYNAINGTFYENAEELEVNTLENALYMGMKNDVSFLIGYTLNLYEHQSTKNENMPLRGFLYIAREFEDYIKDQEINIYSGKLQRLPTPKYIVFYNGTADEPDERIMKLSDAFLIEGGCVECTARLLNINYGHNLELMKKCKPLEDYSFFIAAVRYYHDKKRYGLEKAITFAIDECVERGILAEILTKQRNEVHSMVLSTFNKELYERDLKEIAHEEGFASGHREGMEQGFKEGMERGATKKLYELVERQYVQGKSAEEIADLFGESLDVIVEILEEIKRGESNEYHFEI